MGPALTTCSGISACPLFRWSPVYILFFIAAGEIGRKLRACAEALEARNSPAGMKSYVVAISCYYFPLVSSVNSTKDLIILPRKDVSVFSRPRRLWYGTLPRENLVFFSFEVAADDPLLWSDKDYTCRINVILLVVYTDSGIHEEKIDADFLLNEMLPKLREYFIKVLRPELLTQRSKSITDNPRLSTASAKRKSKVGWLAARTRSAPLNGTTWPASKWNVAHVVTALSANQPRGNVKTNFVKF